MSEARVHKVPDRDLATPPFSALVAAWNEAQMIERHVASFIALPGTECELILCAGGADDTLSRAKRAAGDNPNVVVIEQHIGQGKQAALRTCFELAQHPWIYLTDADCLFSEEVLRSLFGVAAGGHRVVTGGSTPLRDQMSVPIVAYQEARDASYDARVGDVADGVLGRNALLRRDVVEAAGGFTANVHTGTDYHLTLQLKALDEPIAHARGSRVQSEYPASPSEYLRMWRRWIKNLLVHSPHGTGRALVTSLILALALTVLPMAAALLWSWALAVVAVALLATASWRRAQDLSFLPTEAAGMRWPVTIRLPGYVYLDQLAVVLAWMDALTDRGRRRW